MLHLCCEGPACNGGQSADAKFAARFEADYGRPVPFAPTEDERPLLVEIRSQVTRTLAVTPHQRTPYEDLVACDRCGHERRYGRSVTAPAEETARA